MAKKKDTRSYHKQVQKLADGGLVQEDGTAPDDNGPPRELRTAEGWAQKRKEEGYAKADHDLEGIANRSIGEHITAAARGLFEGTKYRDRLTTSRDPVNPLYDRRRAPRED